MSKFKKRMLIVCLGCGAAGNAIAAETSVDAAARDDAQLPKWYVGAFIGQAEGEVGNSQMNERMAEQGYDAQAKVKNLARESYSVMAGYHWSKYLALEAAYTDLGKVETTLTGNVADIQDFLRSADVVHPASADGYEFNVYGRYPLAKRWDVFARAGLMYSDSDYHARATSGELDKLSEDRKIHALGLGVEYALTERWTLRAAASRYQLHNENVDVMGLGVLYQFLREQKQTPPPAALPPPPAPVVAPVVVAAPPPPAPPSVEDILRQQGFSVQQGDRGLIAELGGVLFATNSAKLTAQGNAAVLKMTEVLKKYPARNVSVEGHTDSQGRAEKNKRLSQARADAVRKALLENGVSADRVVARGYGAKYPVASNKDEAGRQLNRRVEFIVSAQDGATVPERTH